MQILIIWSIRLKPKQEMQIICLGHRKNGIRFLGTAAST